MQVMDVRGRTLLSDVIFIAASGDRKSHGKRLQGFFARGATCRNTDSIKDVIEPVVIPESGRNARYPLSRQTYRM